MPTRLLKIRARMSFPSFPGGDEMAEELKNSLGRFVKSTVSLPATARGWPARP